MLPVPGGAVVPGAGGCTRRWTSVSGVVAGPPSTPPSAGPSGMLSSPGTPQTAKITRSAVCNSALAANEKRVAGGGGGLEGPNFSGAARCIWSLGICFYGRLSVSP